MEHGRAPCCLSSEEASYTGYTVHTSHGSAQLTPLPGLNAQTTMGELSEPVCVCARLCQPGCGKCNDPEMHVGLTPDSGGFRAPSREGRDRDRDRDRDRHGIFILATHPKGT
jgi:hypothetical protein